MAQRETELLEPETQYRYEHFKPKTLVKDMSFRGGPRPGDICPDFDLETTDGRRVRKSDFVGQRPALITFGSLTCPMTRSANPILKRFYEDYGGRVEFITVYVREAHPGDRIPQSASFEEKKRYAEQLKSRDRLPWTVAVDDIEGGFHRAMGAHPNSCYIVDQEGRVAFRSLWSNDPRAISEGLECVAAGKTGSYSERRSRVVPVLSGIGVMAETLEQAGPQAQHDALYSAAPLYGLAKLASAFKPLPPLGRGVAAVAVSAAGVYLLAKLIGAAFGRREYDELY